MLKIISCIWLIFLFSCDSKIDAALDDLIIESKKHGRLFLCIDLQKDENLGLETLHYIYTEYCSVDAMSGKENENAK